MMPEVLVRYHSALHRANGNALTARALLDVVRQVLDEGVPRDDVYRDLERLYDWYSDNGSDEECEAVADVLDAFVGWSPRRAAVQ
jgi:hypothetical protein